MNANTRPRLVFIHGTSGFKEPEKWLDPLNQSLHALEVDAWGASDVPKVDYRPFLKKKPKSSGKSRKAHLAMPSPEAKASFESNRDELLAILAKYGTTKKAHGEEVSPAVRKAVAKYGRAAAFRKSAERYRSRRKSVCSYVLSVLDEVGPGDLILIGYSLGSVVAADLLPQLRPDQHVRLLVTIGSPLGAGSWDHTKNALEPFPYDRLDAWVNIHNRLDWVTGRRGIEGDIDQAIDVRIGRFPWPANGSTRKLATSLREPQGLKRDPKKLVLSQHKVHGYTRHAALAAAIDWALKASREGSKVT